jgi:hypothetical protein
MWAIFVIIMLLGFVMMTAQYAIVLFGPWMLGIIIAALLLALVVVLVRNIVAQLALTYVATGVACLVMVTQLPFHPVSFFCLVLVGLVMYAAGSMVCRDSVVQTRGMIAGLAVLPVAPLTMTIYAFCFISGGAGFMALVVTLAGLAGAIWIASSV